MSGAAGGGVGLAVGVAVAAPALVAAGVAYGVAAGVNFAVDSIASAWEERERLVELQRKQMQIQEDRFQQYNQAVAAFQEAATLARSVGLSVPSLPLDLTPDAPLDQLQDAMVRLQTATARLQREYEAAATIALVQATRAAAEAEAAQAAWTEERDRLNAGNQELREELKRTRRLLAEAERRIAAQEAQADARLEAAQEQAADLRARAVAERARTAQARQQKRIAIALALIPADMDAQARQRIDHWIAEIPTLTEERLEAAVIDLETLCSRAASDSARRSHDDQTAAAVLTALAGCSKPNALEISRRASEYLAGRTPWDPELPNKARAELERITKDLESLAAAEILAESFLELGYEIGPDFETAVVASDGAFVHHADWGDAHALQVDLSDAERIVLQVVREGDPSAAASSRERAEDEVAEQRLCDGLEDIVAEAGERGLRIDIDMRIDPGDEAVTRVRDTGRGTRRVRRAAKDREREIGEG